MKRICSMEDWERVGVVKLMEKAGKTEPCGLYYDDATNSTICPHKYIPGQTIIYNAENNYGFPKEIAPGNRTYIDDGVPKP